MASLKIGFFIPATNDICLNKKRMGGSSSSAGFVPFKSDLKGRNLVISETMDLDEWSLKGPANLSINAQASSMCIPRSMRWWEKSLKPNMVEINSAQDLVDSLLNAGDKLVIIDFYSPGCGGCKALHPKICQLAELNANVQILKVNYEELKPMCHSLNIHVLPFFRFYRGAEGRVCSFSCTNATIKKFKDALAKHGTDRCSLGPAKGLEVSELLKLASNSEASFSLPMRSSGIEMEKLALTEANAASFFGKTASKIEKVK